MTAKLRRLIATAFVVGAASLAFAAIGNPFALRANPRITVIRHQLGSPGTGMMMLQNTESMPFSVGSITYDCGPAPAMGLVGGSGANPFTIPGNSSQSVAIACPMGLAFGMHRCTFTVRDTVGDPILDFIGVCETHGMPVLSPSPPSLMFNSVPVGSDSLPQTVLITNTGTQSVSVAQLQISDDNFLISTPCQNELDCELSSISVGSSASVDVICRPNSPGAKSGGLFAVGTNGFYMPSPVLLTCDGAGGGSGVLTMTPSSIDLATPIEVIDPASAPALITLGNGGTGSLTVTEVTISDDGVNGASDDWGVPTFDGQCTALPCTIAMGQGLNVRMTFNPSAFNSRPARLVVDYTNPGQQQATATLNGFGQGATLELASSETTLDFGVVPLNMPVGKFFSLKNNGNRPTTATLMPGPSSPFTFPTTVNVSPGFNPIVTVTCQSPTEINDSRTLTLGAADVTTSPFDLTLNCDVRNTSIVANPTSHGFGEIRRNSGQRQQTFMIDRVGAGPPIQLVSASLVMPAPSMVSLGALSAMQTPATVTLTVDPTMDGPLDTAITVTAMAGQPIAIPISGSVVTASFTTPEVVSLGTFCVGQPTSGGTLTLASTGTGRIDMIEPSMMTAPSPFDLELTSPSVYPAQLDPMNDATVLVTPKRGVSAETVEDFVVWMTDAGNDTTKVTAEFVSDGGAIAPGELNFGEAKIRVATAPPQQVTLQNCDTVPLELEMPNVPQPFVIDDQFPTELQPAQKTTFEVAFRPTELGFVEKQLTVESKAGDMFSVTLRGTGIADGSGSGDDTGELPQTSFYACNCSSDNPSGMLTISFVLLLVLRRRRP